MIEEIKRQAAGRCGAVLGMQLARNDSAGQPCPKCKGTDRFNLDREFETNGKVYCRHCLPKGTGDVIGTYGWFHGIENPEAIKRLGEELGVKPSDAPKRSLIEQICHEKRMPIDAFMQFEPTLAKRGKLEVVRVPVWNGKAERHSYFDLWPNDKGKFARGQGMAGFFFPGRLPQAGETWHLVEGVKDAAALVALGFNAAGMPSCKLSPMYANLFRGVHVVFVPDLDIPGHYGAKSAGGILAGIAASVRIARLPGEIREKQGEDVRDIIRKPNGEQLVRDAITNAVDWEPEEQHTDKRPEVLLTLNEGFVADQVIKHLGNLGWVSPWIPERLQESVRVFVRGGSLVHAIESEDELTKGMLSIRSLPASLVRERITQACQLTIEQGKENDIEIVPTRPIRWLVDAIHQRGYYGGSIRPLTGVVQSPTIRADGSIIQQAGYDEASGLIYRPNAEFPQLAENPTREDAQRAIEELNHVTIDFPFVDPADRSGWLAMLLSMIGRPCVDGCVPMFVTDGNTRGSGKSLLNDAASLIAYGRPAPRKTFTRDDDEQRKLVTSIAIEGTPCVLFDNLDVQLGGANIDAALTARSWNDRVLGASKTTGELPLRTVWAVTGNNIAYGSDVARRVLPIRLESQLEAPENRTGFVHSDLLGFVRDNRPKLAIAALTILRAYYVAGCPSVPDGIWGSFEEWTRIIRGSLVWAGAADPLPTRKSATESDETRSLLGMLVTGLTEADPDKAGLTVGEIERIVVAQNRDNPSCPTLLEAVAAICGDRWNAKRFGRKLLSFKNRTWQGWRIESESAHGGVKRWKVREGYGGYSGFENPQSLRGEKEIISSMSQDDICITYRDRGEPNPSNPHNPPLPIFDTTIETGLV
jgi:hypothetical protein